MQHFVLIEYILFSHSVVDFVDHKKVAKWIIIASDVISPRGLWKQLLPLQELEKPEETGLLPDPVLDVKQTKRNSVVRAS